MYDLGVFEVQESDFMINCSKFVSSLPYFRLDTSAPAQHLTVFLGVRRQHLPP
jgi:hypothetical protein